MAGEDQCALNLDGTLSQDSRWCLVSTGYPLLFHILKTEHLVVQLPCSPLTSLVTLFSPTKPKQ